MNPRRRLKDSFSFLAGRPRANSATTTTDAQASTPIDHQVEIGDVPVFDCRQRKVGFIAAPAAGNGGNEFTPAQWMSHCMNDPVSWLPSASDADSMHLPADSLCLRRIVLMSGDDRICGVVALESTDIRPGPREAVR